MNSDAEFSTDQSREIIGLWRDEHSPDAKYFEAAESEAWQRVFWSEGGIFQKYMRQLDFTCTAEIAAGQGRHSSRILDRCKKLYLIDTSIVAVSRAKERFSNYSHVEVILSEDGLSLNGIDDRSLSAAFSFDAMVHFEPLTMFSYLKELSRTLNKGGRAVLHYSNFSGNPTGSIKDVKGWRNYMTEDLFAHFVSRCGLRILDRTTMDWSLPDSDAICLLEA